MSSTVAFVDHLVAKVPELAEAYRLHLADFDVLLPHVFMGEVARFVVTHATSAPEGNPVSRILGCLEQGLQSGDKQVAELIGVSFVENLSSEKATLEGLLPRLGEALRREVKSICGV